MTRDVMTRIAEYRPDGKDQGLGDLPI